MNRKHSLQQRGFLLNKWWQFDCNFIEAIAAFKQNFYGAWLPSPCDFGMGRLLKDIVFSMKPQSLGKSVYIGTFWCFIDTAVMKNVCKTVLKRGLRYIENESGYFKYVVFLTGKFKKILI